MPLKSIVRHACVFVSLVATVGVAARGGGQPVPPVDVKALYVKQDVLIPMRDGTKLFTSIYSPRDESQRYPIMVVRTGYGIPPYGADAYPAFVGPSVEFTEERYIFVYQDVRGRFKSEGTFVHHVPLGTGPGGTDESTDAWDTIDWLVSHVRNHNGRVGQWGISWPGWEVSMGMLNAHPALKASSPQAPPQDQFDGDDYHSHGAYQLAYGFNWMTGNGQARRGPTEARGERFRFPTPDGYDFFLRLGSAANAIAMFDPEVPTFVDHMNHGVYDAYWQARNVPKDLHGITHAVLIVGGWFDAEDFYGPLRMYRAIERQNPRNISTLVFGPWVHGGWARNGERIGAIDFGPDPSAHYRRAVELPFFNYYLKDKGTPSWPEALMFETGANRWRSFPAWPPPDTTPRTWHFASDGQLTTAVPAGDPGGAFDEYVSDPQRPVPYTTEITTDENRTFVVEDQRFASRRPDVLVYRTAPLSDDVTIAGPVSATIHASSSGTDADIVVKLIDVFPDDAPDPSPNPTGVRMGGYQMLLVGDIFRAKFRRSLTTPEPLVPGEPFTVTFELGDRLHTFRKGHRVMVQVQSSWFPMFDRNPQTFVDIYHAKPDDYRRATLRVYRSGERASGVTVQVLPPTGPSSMP
ncbi:MAG: CocE/NonD family hydrolase [Vicinamibacterales bacterium]